MRLSNLPPGVTDAMIEEQCREETEEETALRFCGMAMTKAKQWDGYQTHELFADILEATDEDFADVLARTRGELELRAKKRRKAEK